MTQIKTLVDTLSGIENDPWNHALFVKGAIPLDEDVPCMILDPNDSDDPEEDPPFAVQSGFKYLLNVQEAQDVARNLLQQKPDVTASDLIRALNYFLQNDAFIKL